MDPRTERMLAEHAVAAAAAPPPPKGLARVLRNAWRWTRAHRIAAGAGSLVFVVAMLIAYDRVVARPAHERERAENERINVERLRGETARQQAALDACLVTAQKESDSRWAAGCRAAGIHFPCRLSGSATDRLEQQEAAARNACLSQFTITLH